MGNARIFTKIDLRRAFNQIRVREGDEWKTAFRTHFGLFESLVMGFGHQNGPPTLQRLMDHLFQQCREFAIIDLDDILIFDEDVSLHTNHVRSVLQILKDNNLYLKLEKCVFDARELQWIGFTVGEAGVGMQPDKVSAILKWKPPGTVKELRSFLGFSNFYSQLIRDYSLISRPLNDLLKKDAKYTWSIEC